MDAVFHDTASETTPGDLKRIRKGTRSCVECEESAPDHVRLRVAHHDC